MPPARGPHLPIHTHIHAHTQTHTHAHPHPYTTAPSTTTKPNAQTTKERPASLVVGVDRLV